MAKPRARSTLELGCGSRGKGWTACLRTMVQSTIPGQGAHSIFFWPQRGVFLDGVNLSPARYDLGMRREGERPLKPSCTP